MDWQFVCILNVELLDILASDGMLVKRPILTNGKEVLVGFKEAEWEEKVKI